MTNELERVEHYLRRCFSDIRYAEEYPDVARAVRDGGFQTPLDHYLRHGMLEGRRLFLEPDASPPLFCAAIFWHGGQIEEAAAIYRAALGPVDIVNLNSKRTLDPRFDIWTLHVHLEQGHFCKLLRTHPRTDRPLDGETLPKLVAAHVRLAEDRLLPEDVTLLQGLLDRMVPEIAVGLLSLVARAVLSSDDPAMNLPLLMHSIYILRVFDVLDFIATLPSDGVRHRMHLVHAAMLRSLRYGDHRGMIDIARATPDLDLFGWVLLGLANLETIENTFFTERGDACRENFEMLERVSEKLRPHLARSSLANYIEGRTAHFLGRFEAAIGFFARSMKQTPWFVHAKSAWGEANVYAGNLEPANKAVTEIFDFTFAPEAAGQAAYYRRWMGTDREVAFVDALDFRAILEEEVVPHQDPLKGFTRGLAIADHDFAIAIACVVEDGSRAFTVLANTKDRVLDLRVADRAMTLRLGDGTSWRYEVFLGPIAEGIPQVLHLFRRGRVLEIFLGRKHYRRIVLPEGFWLRGETYRLQFPYNPNETKPFAAGARYWIEKYRTGSDAKRLRLVSLFWGTAYARMFNETMVPSLLKLSRLDRIAGEYETVLDLIVPPREYALIQDTVARLTRDLPIRLDLRTGLLSSDHDTNAGLLHAILPAVWQEHEADGCLTLMCQPDHVFGTGLLDVLRRNGPNEYTVCGHPRVDAADGFAAAAKAFKDGRVRSNPGLVALGPLAHPHVTFATGIGSREHWLNAIRLSDRFEVRFKEPPPLCLRVRKDLLSVFSGDPYGGPFEQIDHDIVDLVYRQDRLRVVDDSKDFFWFEFSGNDKNYPTIRNSYWSSAAQYLARKTLTWWLPAAEREVASGQAAGPIGKPAGRPARKTGSAVRRAVDRPKRPKRRPATQTG